MRASVDILVVDLDGTALRSDMLFESFWSAFSVDWLTPFRCGVALLKGKAKLKQTLAQAAEVDVTSLPYDDQVLEYVRAWKADGGRAVLVTATNETLARAIADHLQIFDEVHGSSETCNLKSDQKAAFLTEHFGEGKFNYVGDSSADLAVWKVSAKAITVNAPEALRHKAEQLAPDAEHLETRAHSIRPYIKALRPHQWLKNLLVFLPVLAAHQLDGSTILTSTLAFVAFSLIASSVYVVNDLLDLAADRAHPRKCKRPFAAGDLPIAHGTWMTVGLITSSVLIGLSIGSQFLMVLCLYYILTTAYSLGLKRRAVIDICVLAGLYTMRIVAGGAATGIELSIWLLAFSIFFFFSLAALKRQAELVDNFKRGKASPSGRGYHVDDMMVIAMMAIGSGYISVLVMALYLNSDAVREIYSMPMALWGICCVLLYWLSRTILLAHRGHMHDDPVVYAAKDRISLVCGVLIFAFAVGGTVL